MISLGDKVESNFPSDALVRGGGGFDPIEDKWKVISLSTYPSEGVAQLIPLADKWKVISL